jgi:hypothetical protein
VQSLFHVEQDAKVPQVKGKCSALGSFAGSVTGPSQGASTSYKHSCLWGTHALKYFEVTYAATFLDGFHLIPSLGKMTLHPNPGLFCKFS